jgi:hypothetical protein
MSDTIKEKKKWERNALVVTLIITLVVLLISIDVYLHPSNNIVNRKENEPSEDYSYYSMKCNQNSTDFSYLIFISNLEGKKLKLDECKILISTPFSDTNLDKYNQNYENLPLVEDYISNKKIYFKLYDTNPIKPSAINLTLSVTYNDYDHNNYLSTFDHFILKTENNDTNEKYNFTNYSFRIISLRDNIIGSIKVMETPTNLTGDDGYVVSESDVISPITTPCFIGIVFLVIFILIQFYLLLTRL